jgi:hypothetical protein
MKMLVFISLVLLFACCRHAQINKKFLAADFKYSTYIWHISEDGYKREFHLADYLHVDSNGNFKLIRHGAVLDTHEYFSGTLNDSVRQIIDSILSNNKYHPQIKNNQLPDTPVLIYDGFTYLLDYKLKDKAGVKIQYINASSRTPENILFLSAFLDTIISNTVDKKIPGFLIEKSYIDTLKKISSYNLLPLPIQPSFSDKSHRFIFRETKH